MTELSQWLEKDYSKFFIFLAATFVVAVVARFIIKRILWKMAGKTETELDDQILETFQDPVSYSIILGGFWHSLHFFQERLGPQLMHTIFAILVTILILIWLVASMGFAHYFVDWLSNRDGRFTLVQPRTKPLFQILFKILALLIAGYFLIISWDLDLTGWLASAGVAGIALGFAAKDTLANLFAGVFIIADAPYKIGDYIVLGNGDRGRVTDIGIRSTRLMTRDDVEVIIPNAIIGNTEIINQSGGPFEMFRLRVAVSVAYGSDVDLVRQILEEIAQKEPLVVKDPFPRLRFRAFGASGLEYELLVWVQNPELKGMALDKLLTTIYKAFAQNQIEIPYPKRDVYLHQATPKPDLDQDHL